MKRVLICLVFASLTLQSAYADDLASAIEAAMAAESRPAEDRARDANRLPAETLAFFGMRNDMRVLELIPSRGWYTRLLAPVLAENGQLYVAIGTSGIKEAQEEGQYPQVEVLDFELDIERSEPYGLINTNDYRFGVEDLDLVLTFRNLHNFTAAGRAVMNQAAFAALAPGGLYGVVDHTARHMEPVSQENRRRLDPVVAIHEITQAGFEFVGFSDLHRKPADDLTLEVGNEAVSGATDRFTLLFRKP